MTTVAATLVAAAATAARGTPLPPAQACRISAADNTWNRRVVTLPLAPGSAGTVAEI